MNVATWATAFPEEDQGAIMQSKFRGRNPQRPVVEFDGPERSCPHKRIFASGACRVSNLKQFHFMINDLALPQVVFAAVLSDAEATVRNSFNP